MYSNKRSCFIFNILLFVFLIVPPLTSCASVIHQSLYINRGVFTTVQKTNFPWIVFNTSPVFNQLNAVITLTTNDTLILKIINKDTVSHEFNIKGHAGFTASSISPADSITDTLHFDKQGIYIYYDSYQYPKYRYLGAAGMICINNSVTSKKFYWNIKEHQSSYNVKLAQNIPVNWNAYAPDYFTFNGMSYPDILDDTTNTWIHGYVGDTIQVALANTGQSAHAIHFHGYHCKILYSANAAQIGWIKDTFPLKSMEAIIVEFVPDKPGYYTVHDHNLLTSTGGGMHLRGMLSILTIY